MSVAPDSNEPQAPVDPTPAPPEARAAATGIPQLRVWTYAVAAALVAGMVAWGIGERTHELFVPSRAGDSRDFSALVRSKAITDRQNAAIVFGALGALLGLFSGAAGGALGRSIRGGAGAALAGLVLGGLGAAVAAYGLTPIFNHFYSDEAPSLVLPFLVRGGIWAIAGMAAGLALGWGSRGRGGIPGALIGGLVGAACGTIAFEVANGLLFPDDRNDAVIPTSTSARLMACLLVSVGVAVGAAVLGRSRSRPADPTAQARS
jgi:hypothetical protein